jgi:hypothetical protein
VKELEMNNIKKSAIILVLSTNIGIVSHAASESMKMNQDNDSKPSGMGKMNPEMMDKKMRSKQAHLLKMHDLSSRILAENNATKKQKLKDEQLELMKNMHMKKMQKKMKMKMKMKSNGKMMDMKQKRQSQMGQ